MAGRGGRDRHPDRGGPDVRAGARPARRPGQRRVAHLRRRPRQHQVLPARPDRPDQLRRSRDRVALAVGRRVPQHRHARRRRVVGGLANHLRGAAAPRSRPLARRAAPLPHQPEGDTADGRRAALHQHADVAGRVDRRRDRRDALGLQPEDLRGRDHDDDRALEPARRGLLVRRPGARGRADPLRDRERLSDLRRRQDGPALCRLRRGRLGRPDRGSPPRRPQTTATG